MKYSLLTIVGSLVAIIYGSVNSLPPTASSSTSEVAVAAADESEPETEISQASPIPPARPESNGPATDVVDPQEADEPRELLPTQNARLLCQAMDNSGLGSAPCTYSGWNSTITLTIDMVASEARGACQDLAAYARNTDMHFGGWRLEIKSPYSGDNSIAFCTLQ